MYIKGKEAFKRDNRFHLRFVCVEYKCEKKHTYFHLDNDCSFAGNTTLLEHLYTRKVFTKDQCFFTLIIIIIKSSP